MIMYEMDRVQTQDTAETRRDQIFLGVENYINAHALICQFLQATLHSQVNNILKFYLSSEKVENEKEVRVMIDLREQAATALFLVKERNQEEQNF